MKNELQSILQGTSQVSHGTLIQTITSYLSRSQATSTLAKGTKPFKTQETKDLITFINQSKLWNCNINFDAFVSQGAEQRVFIENDHKVLKLNGSDVLKIILKG
jgi:Serine/Threonine/Tyrosine Kinase found in polyvalent proteins